LRGETEIDKTNAKILDACCGSKMFWFNKDNPDVLFCDKRELSDTLCDGRSLEVNPDVICDFTNLPFSDNQFKIVVFDPPHLLKIGETSWMAKKYGKLDENWPTMIKQGFDECLRVLDVWGTLIFKWSENQITVKEILNAIGVEPLFGHKSGKLNNTHWMCFMKFPE
jgi:hypothetical protein